MTSRTVREASSEASEDLRVGVLLTDLAHDRVLEGQFGSLLVQPDEGVRQGHMDGLGVLRGVSDLELAPLTKSCTASRRCDHRNGVDSSLCEGVLLQRSEVSEIVIAATFAL